MIFELEYPLFSSVIYFVAIFICFLFLESTLNDNLLLPYVVNEYRKDSLVIL